MLRIPNNWATRFVGRVLYRLALWVTVIVAIALIRALFFAHHLPRAHF